ncbi:GntR family transcriptional regulator [Plantibacter sp. YIM 135347]|uniref:GntR family transcriptional regulator n=1 Tax=Plantibacter sp. YIM 135347 TaxID=3423919 RepID=UPI003D33716E
MPVPHTSPRIQRTLLRNDVYVHLRDEILRGAIAPGEQLREADIERATGASRTPVREAINRLKADGFVDVLPQRETRVRKIEPSLLGEALTVERYIVESVIPAAVPRLTERDLGLVRAYRDAVVADPSAEVELLWSGESFAGVSGMLLRAYGNRTLLRAARAINTQLRWAVGADRRLARLLLARAGLLDELVLACERRDPDGVLRVVGQYCDEAVAPYLEALQRESQQPDSICASSDRMVEPAVKRGLLREQVHAAMLDAIARGQFASGERLREEELMEWLGVSRTPLREALITLEQVGLVESLPGRFTRVTPVDRGTMVDAFQAMTVFGALSVRLGMPRLDESHLACLDASIIALAAAAESGNVTEALLATNDFVRTVTRAAGNRTLEIIEERVVPRLFKRVELDPPLDLPLLLAEVRALRRAIADGEVDAAEVAVAALYEPRAFMAPPLTPSSTPSRP